MNHAPPDGGKATPPAVEDPGGRSGAKIEISHEPTTGPSLDATLNATGPEPLVSVLGRVLYGLDVRPEVGR